MLAGFLILFSACSIIEGQVEYGPITTHFDDWLERNGYGKYNFARLDLGNYGSFGGMTARDFRFLDTSKDPVVFFHGNSDAALYANDFSTGWTMTVEYFLNQGYSLSQLYGTSWGNTNTTAAIERDHDCATVFRLRKFAEAVLEYTGASQLNIISHSMGVTLARKVVEGGVIHAEDGSCNIGRPLTSRVRAFLGIAGANYGLCACVGHFLGTIWPTCNDANGLWPGEQCFNQQGNAQCAEEPFPTPCNGLKYSRFLMDLNSSLNKAGKKVFSMWSQEDELIDLRRATRDGLIGDGNMVWGRPTSEIPHSDANMIYLNLTHMQTKHDTASDQYYIISNLKIPN